MQNGPNKIMSTRSKLAGLFTARTNRSKSNAARPQLGSHQNAQRTYTRYLALGEEEARSGNIVGAENYYQHAEHFFRLMSSNRGST
jgi:hypothetical protein